MLNYWRVGLPGAASVGDEVDPVGEDESAQADAKPEWPGSRRRWYREVDRGPQRCDQAAEDEGAARDRDHWVRRECLKRMAVECREGRMSAATGGTRNARQGSEGAPGKEGRQDEPQWPQHYRSRRGHAPHKRQLAFLTTQVSPRHRAWLAAPVMAAMIAAPEIAKTTATHAQQRANGTNTARAAFP